MSTEPSWQAREVQAHAAQGAAAASNGLARASRVDVAEGDQARGVDAPRVPGQRWSGGKGAWIGVGDVLTSTQAAGLSGDKHCRIACSRKTTCTSQSASTPCTSLFQPSGPSLAPPHREKMRSMAASLILVQWLGSCGWRGWTSTGVKLGGDRLGCIWN